MNITLFPIIGRNIVSLIYTSNIDGPSRANLIGFKIMYINKAFDSVKWEKISYIQHFPGTLSLFQYLYLLGTVSFIFFKVFTLLIDNQNLYLQVSQLIFHVHNLSQ